LSEAADDAEQRWTPAAIVDLRGRDSTPARRAAKPALAKTAPDESAAAPDPKAIRQQAYDKGFAEGLAAGQAQAERVAAEMTALLNAMAMPFRDMDAVLLRELLELTERVVGAVLGREHELGVDLEPILAEALAALGSSSVPVEVLLQPGGCAALPRGWSV
jgi:flagellar biosynthesis/type III secretory pathway protein FliH